MKNNLFLVLFALMILLLVSCTQYLEYQSEIITDDVSDDKIALTLTIHEPGTLEDYFADIDYRNVVKFTLFGSINGTDLKFIRKMSGADEYGKETDGALEQLDLSGTTFVSGGDPYFIYINDEVMEPCYLSDNEVSRYAFGYCKLLKIVLPDSIEKYGPQAFYSCKFLKTINNPASLQYIGKSAFFECNCLISKIIVPEGTTVIPSYVFYGCTAVSIDVPESVTTLGDGCFYGCTRLKSLNLPNLISFGDECFRSCSQLESFHIPLSMRTVPDYAFYGCEKLKEVNLSHVERIGRMAFVNCSSLTHIEVCPQLEFIDDYAFWKSGIHQELVLPESVRYIGYQAFYGTGVLSVTINSAIRTYESEDILKQSTGPFYSCKQLKRVVVGEGCRTLGLSFEGCSALEDVVLPSSLDSLGYIFKDYSSIIDDVDGGLTYGIGRIFKDCTSLSRIVFPTKLKYISESCFSGCTNLKEITIPSSVNCIGSSAFYGCKSLCIVHYSKNLKYVPYGCFKDCIDLKNIDSMDSVQKIAYRSFANSGIDTIKLPQALSKLEEQCFYSCLNLKSVLFPSSLRKIGNHVFYGCEALSNVDFTEADNLESIGDCSFYHCSMLKDVIFPENLKTIGEYCFSSCRLESIAFPHDLQSIGDGCFEGCMRLSHIFNNSTTPQAINQNVFDERTFSNAILHVPASSLSMYHSHSVWSLFAEIVANDNP